MQPQLIVLTILVFFHYFLLNKLEMMRNGFFFCNFRQNKLEMIRNGFFWIILGKVKGRMEIC